VRTSITIVLTLAGACLAAALYFLGGGYDVAADRPHGAFMQWIVAAAREASIAARAKAIEVPSLDDAAAIRDGANEYAEMCAGCHLAPGVPDNEFRRGLNPPAPELAKTKATGGSTNARARRQFWIIEHGIQMSAMPAWGITHDDRTLWNIVAFLQQLPTMTPEQYATMTAHAHAEHEASAHGQGDEENPDALQSKTPESADLRPAARPRS